MAIDFPSSPTVGQNYTFGGISYVFTAQGIWAVVGAFAPASSGSRVTLQKFTANGTYTPTSGTQFVIVECIGGGGGGGSSTSGSANCLQGAGGGAGGYSRSQLTAAQIGASQAVTVGAGGAGGGAGGTTSFGTLVIALGGSSGSVAVSGTTVPIGGAGAAPGTGDVAIGGTPGGMGLYSTTNNPISLSGNGGSGPLGGSATATLNVVPPAANGFGGGGAGGAVNGASTIAGGPGSAGIVIITEYTIGVGPAGPAGATGAQGPAGIGMFPAGTRMMFQQTNAPTGWTKDTNQNDAALRIVNGTVSSGGSVAWSALFSRTTTDAFTPAVTNMAYHSHPKTAASTPQGGGSPYMQGAGGADFVAYVDNQGGGNAFAMGIDMRVRYSDCIIAVKD
jgi:hypothetical protein